jgi:hypothetical protein
MSDVFEAIDPRGRRVICSDDCWNNHILDSHPSMQNQEAAVKEAIEKSIGIYQDAHFG